MQVTDLNRPSHRGISRSRDIQNNQIISAKVNSTWTSQTTTIISPGSNQKLNSSSTSKGTLLAANSIQKFVFIQSYRRLTRRLLRMLLRTIMATSVSCRVWRTLIQVQVTRPRSKDGRSSLRLQPAISTLSLLRLVQAVSTSTSNNLGTATTKSTSGKANIINASSVSSTRCMSATIMFVGTLAALQMSRSESRNSNIRTSKHRNSSRSKEATSPSLVAQLAATTLTRIAPSKSTTVAFAQKRSGPKNRGCIKACALIASKEHR